MSSECDWCLDAVLVGWDVVNRQGALLGSTGQWHVDGIEAHIIDR